MRGRPHDHRQRPSPSCRSPAPIGRPGSQRETLKGLGLNKIGRKANVVDTPANRGMIAKVAHLVRVVDGE